MVIDLIRGIKTTTTVRRECLTLAAVLLDLSHWDIGGAGGAIL